MKLKNTKRINKFILIGVVLIGFILAIFTTTKYYYRRKITITEQAGMNLTNYDVAFIIDTTTPISERKMNPDCSDIEFTYKNGSEEYNIPYMIFDCNTSNTTIWVRVPFIPANSSTTIYMYYGRRVTLRIKGVIE